MFQLLKKSTSLRALTNIRDDERAAHVLIMDPSAGLSNTEQSGLPLADVPFLLTACSDTLNQTSAKNLGVGDYGFVGFVSSSFPVSAADTSKDLYADSMENIRKRPGVSSFFASLAVLKTKIPFYEERYSSQVAKDVEPSLLFGDVFFGESDENAMLGEFLTAIGYGTINQEDFVLDTKTRGVFDTFDNADFAQSINGDIFKIASGTLTDGQKGKDTFETVRRHLQGKNGNSGNGNSNGNGTGNGNSNGNGSGNGNSNGGATPGPAANPTPNPTIAISTPNPTIAISTPNPTIASPLANGGSDGSGGGGNVAVPVETFTKELFYSHALIVQWVADIAGAKVESDTFTAEGIKHPQCAADTLTSSFIPPDIQGGPGPVVSRRKRDLGAVGSHSMMRGANRDEN